jgi:UDP-2-acetamido-2-deoxy-ribo-hexuluronate aminotransferase
MEFIDLKAQYAQLRAPVMQRIQAVLDHGAYIMGPEIGELEKKLSEYVGVSHCLTVSSGTDALLIAMMALDIRPGDEVITTPFTFIATGEMIALLGAKPVFVDIDPETLNIDPALIERAITPRTRAIMPVSLYGQCADLDAINAIAAAHGLAVIEDGAQSFGATYRGRRSCGLSTIGCTSFFPSKPLGCYGDGGAVFTDDEALATAMREIRVHGQDRRYHHPRIGINARMDTLQAAILLAKFEVFPDEVVARERIGARYTQRISARCPTVLTPTVLPTNTSVYAQYTVQVENRAEVSRHLNSRGVPTAVHYPMSLHQQPAFAFLGLGPGSFPVTERAAGRVLSLPMHPNLDEATQDLVVEALRDAVQACREPAAAP